MSRYLEIPAVAFECFPSNIFCPVAPWPGGPGGAMAPPGKNLSDNFDACRKFLKFLFVKFKKCSFHKYSVL